MYERYSMHLWGIDLRTVAWSYVPNLVEMASVVQKCCYSNLEMPASEVEEDTMGTAFVVTVALESIIGAAVAFVAVIGDFKPIRLSDQKTHMSWDSLNARPSFVLYKKDSAARQLLQDAVKSRWIAEGYANPRKPNLIKLFRFQSCERFVEVGSGSVPLRRARHPSDRNHHRSLQYTRASGVGHAVAPHY
ncbi:hypothetical protein FOZ60_002334 [Perkinsus olseni]|uniref:Uncharacterized protein n=1 Tax=Perkinsus olseni TaxID=32597 RepID=A0A7J6PIZ9_PEROL|nr:hypothetical protein FOZ60_002334 [Perkinsus olseni]